MNILEIVYIFMKNYGASIISVGLSMYLLVGLCFCVSLCFCRCLFVSLPVHLCITSYIILLLRISVGLSLFLFFTFSACLWVHLFCFELQLIYFNFHFSLARCWPVWWLKVVARNQKSWIYLSSKLSWCQYQSTSTHLRIIADTYPLR